MEISFARGDSYEKGFIIRNGQTGEPDTTVYDEIYFTIKTSYKLKEVVLQKTMTGGGIVSDGNGHYTFSLKPSDTDKLTFSIYDFDIELVKGDDTFKRTFTGKVKVTEEVTYTCNEVIE